MQCHSLLLLLLIAISISWLPTNAAPGVLGYRMYRMSRSARPCLPLANRWLLSVKSSHCQQQLAVDVTARSTTLATRYADRPDSSITIYSNPSGQFAVRKVWPFGLVQCERLAGHELKLTQFNLPQFAIQQFGFQPAYQQWTTMRSSEGVATEMLVRQGDNGSCLIDRVKMSNGPELMVMNRSYKFDFPASLLQPPRACYRTEL